jgi:hypothetical protein
VSERCVVYGDYPPFPGAAAAETLSTVRTLLADGRDVEVVSPRPSAAHHHADIIRPAGAAAFARRIAGGPDVVACFDSTMLAAGGRRAVAARAVLAVALRRARNLEVRLSPLPRSPDPAWVRAVVSPAGRVVVASPADGRVLAGLGVAPGRIVEPDEARTERWYPSARDEDTGEAGDNGDRAGAEPWRLGAAPAADEIEAEIRRRAVFDRAAESTSTVAPSWPLHLLTPLHMAPVQSSKPLFRLVKQVVHRLVAWEVVPIVEQVNHLQRATIEAVDRASVEERAHPDDSGPAATSS